MIITTVSYEESPGGLWVIQDYDIFRSLRIYACRAVVRIFGAIPPFLSLLAAAALVQAQPVDAHCLWSCRRDDDFDRS